MELWGWDEQRTHAHFNHFRLSNEEHRFRLHVDGYTGNAGDSLTSLNGAAFCTFDADDVEDCATSGRSGWWWNSSPHSNLNGVYKRGKYFV